MIPIDKMLAAMAAAVFSPCLVKPNATQDDVPGPRKRGK